jgi:hypothetical protein
MSAPTEAEREKAMAEVKPCARMKDRTWPFAVLFLLLGIISDAVNRPLGLEATSWLLLGIAALAAAVFFRMGRAIYWQMNSDR